MFRHVAYREGSPVAATVVPNTRSARGGVPSGPWGGRARRMKGPVDLQPWRAGRFCYELGPASKLTLSTSSDARRRYLAMFSSGSGSALIGPQLCTISDGSTFGFTG